MPRKPKALSHIQCLNLQPREKRYRLYFGGGLQFEISPSGGKHWYSKYHFAGKEKRLAHGPFPAISILDAQEKHLAVRRLLLANIDPAVAKREAKAKAELATKNTFKAVALEWHENSLEKWSAAHAEDVKHRLDKDVFPKLGGIPIQHITPPEIVSVLQAIEKRGARETARRVKFICSQVFTYAKVKGWTGVNPTEGVGVILKPVIRGHFASLSLEELPQFLATMEADDGTSEQVKLAMKLLMLTFVRTNELIGMRWSEINFDNATWTIAAERMKGQRHKKRAHIVPLSSQALQIIKKLKLSAGKSEYAFPGRNTWKQPMSNMAILQCLRRLGYARKMTGHGFRSLAKSIIMQELKYREEVPDRQLAHLPDTKYGEAYDRATFLPERVKMMQEWADYIDALYGSATSTT